jgi:hypothetical protein
MPMSVKPHDAARNGRDMPHVRRMARALHIMLVAVLAVAEIGLSRVAPGQTAGSAATSWLRCSTLWDGRVTTAGPVLIEIRAAPIGRILEGARATGLSTCPA